MDVDDYVVLMVISLKDILDCLKVYEKLKWYCFYGGLRGMEVVFFSRMLKLVKRMNVGYVDGVVYCGWMLILFILELENWRNKYVWVKKLIFSVLAKMGKEWRCFFYL